MRHKVRNEAILQAGQDGYIDAVKVLVLEVNGAQTGKLDYASYHVLKIAAVAAAGNGHLVVVELLLLEIIAGNDLEDDDSDYDSEEEERINSQDVAWEILDKAAANGNLGVVKFAAGYTRQTEFSELAYEISKTLLLAILGGHADIVYFLLEPGRYTWRYSEALEKALDEGQETIAELIYQGYPKYVEQSFSVA